MAIQTQPTRIRIPFANSGTKNTIPATNSSPSASQAASWTDGFPAQNSLPLSAGGIPPARGDFNGIFNAITQSERFTEEGGIWTWDSGVDYAANRMVLGSNGKLYWSVAQSGPNVGGASDPTTDPGTHWGCIPVKTPSISNNSSVIATTEWVRDVVVGANLYVDGSVSSSGNGLTAATAFKTIGEAIAAAKQRTGYYTTVYVAGGTYNENVSVSAVKLHFIITGSVSVNRLILGDTAYAMISEDASGYTFSVSASGTAPTAAGVQVNMGSTLVMQCALSVTVSSISYGIYINSGSTFTSNSAITVNASTATEGAFIVNLNSFALCNSSLSITGSSIARGVMVNDASFAAFVGGISEPAAGINNGSGRALQIVDGSICVLSGGSTYNLYGNTGVSVSQNSSLYISSSAVVNITVNTNSAIGLYSELDSLIFHNGTGNCTINTGAGVTTAVAVKADYYSVIALSGHTTTINGTYDYVFSCYGCSYISIVSSANLSGSPTGKKYLVGVGGYLYTSNRGDAFIPGTAGTGTVGGSVSVALSGGGTAAMSTEYAKFQ